MFATVIRSDSASAVRSEAQEEASCSTASLDDAPSGSGGVFGGRAQVKVTTNNMT